MLIGNSLPESIFIRIAVPALRLITPVSIIFCAFVVPSRPSVLRQPRWLAVVSGWLLAEASFYLAVYLPLRFYLQRPAQHPEPPPKVEREVLVRRTLSSLDEPEYYISKWFPNAPLNEIKRENLKEFYAWSFMNKRLEQTDELEEIELEKYVTMLEAKAGRQLQHGRGNAKALRTTLDPVPMQHRPLIWYFIVLQIDIFSGLYLRYHAFHYHASRTIHSVATFPFQLHSLTLNSSPSSRISYWHHKGTSKTKTPVLFIHGIGIGIYTCVSFMKELAGGTLSASDSASVIAVDLTSINARICAIAPSAIEVKEEIRKILDKHGWDEVVLVAHSYGTAVASTILRDPTFAFRIKAAVLMDPICFMLHLPDVAYNFTRRLPTRANERMLHYFASQDMMISHTLARRFFWNQCILFKEDLPADMPLTVTLSGQDLIVPTRAVWNYLTGREASVEGDEGWEEGLVRVQWFDALDHAGCFAAKGCRRGIAREVGRYCEMGSSESP